MGEADLQGLTLTDPDTRGMRYFVLYYNAINFNASSVTISDITTNVIFRSAYSMVHFDGISIYNNGANANVYGTIRMVFGNPAVFLAAGLNLTRAVDTFATYPNITIPRNVIHTANTVYPSWLYVALTGYAATDDLSITVWGWVDTEYLPTTPQAVSLEAYKWPLTKRRA